MLRSRSSTCFSLAMLAILLLLQGCGDDSSRAKTPDTSSSNYSDLRLKQLDVSPGTISPAFDPEYTGPYTLNVGSEVSSIDITAAAKVDGVLLEIVKHVLEKDDKGNLVSKIRVEANTIDPGEVDTKTLAPGDNRIVLNLSEPGRANILSYELVVHRDNVDAHLQNLAFVYYKESSDSTVAGNQLITLTPTFDSEVKSYSAALPYEACQVKSKAITSERHTELEVDGRSVKSGEEIAFPIAVGEQVVSYVSTPESGSAIETYQVSFTRAAGTETELAEDDHLARLEIGGAEIGSIFNCRVRVVNGYANLSVGQLDITAMPAVAGATMRIGTPVYTSTTSGFIVTGLKDDAVDLFSGVSFPAPLEGDFIQAIEVTATNGTSKRYYEISIKHLSTNVVRVTTASELQTALLNAEPNDEIRVAAGVYSGIASPDSSGSERAHFYSARSGTEEAPIRLHAEAAGDTILQADGASVQTTLMLAGDYWLVDGFEIRGGNTGLELNNADHNIVSICRIDGVNERGIVITNGSSDNVIRDNVIANTGLAPRSGFEQNVEGIVVGADADHWSSAPEGSLDATVADNAIHSNSFGPNVQAEAVDIKEGALRTRVQFNTFDAEGISTAAEDASLVVVKGNDSDISYNTFVNDSGAALTQLVSAKNVVRDWVTQNWGENTRLYQNLSELGSEMAIVPFANSHDVSVFNVAENRHIDGGDVAYLGEGINQVFSVPVYQIQSTEEDGLCLVEESPETVETLTRVLAETCSDSSAQLWKFSHAGGGYLFLSPADKSGQTDTAEQNILAPNAPSMYSSSGVSLLYSAGWDLSDLENPSFANWKLIYSNGTVVLQNRSTWSGVYYINAPDSSASSEYLRKYAFVTRARDFGQLFRLIEKQ